MEPEKKSSGALVGLVVIIIILIIGGIYIWMSRQEALPNLENTQAQSEAPVTNQDSAALDALEQESNSLDANAGVDVNAVQ